MEQPKPEQSSVQEFVVRIPKDKQKKYNVMRFNNSLNIDIEKWKQVKMERENNFKEFKQEEENPKFGAGSEFGKEQKEEARRKKHGIVVKQYNPEEQPWMLRLGGKGGKRYKGIREGGVTENVSYYMFSKAADGAFEAYPVEEWYNFMPVNCFKALSAEEAEEEYGRRDKVLNYFSIMVRKRLQPVATEEDDEEEKKLGTKKKKSQKDFKITDMDEWANFADSGDSDNDDEAEETSNKPAKKNAKKKKKGHKSDDEAQEESDEGDFDDKEVDYITSGSSDGEEIEEEEKANRDMKGVEDEEALRKLMSEEEDEEEEPNKETEENAENKEKAAEQKPKQKQKKSDSSGESSSDSSDSDFDDPKFTSAIFVPNFQKSKKKNGSSDNSAGSSRANTPTKLQGDKDGQKAQKRKYPDVSSSSLKKPKLENQAGSSSMSSTLDGINEETVRRYLQRKPMMASELLHKFKSKKTKMSSEQLVTKIADVLKKMDLQKTNVKGKMYLSLKTK